MSRSPPPRYCHRRRRRTTTKEERHGHDHGADPQQVFQHHAEALIGGDIDGIVEDYSDDAVFITPAGVKRGKQGVREAFTQLLEELPNGEWAVPTTIFEGDALFIEWTCDSARNRVEDGVDTFIFRDGQIRLQTVRHTLIPR